MENKDLELVLSSIPCSEYHLKESLLDMRFSEKKLCCVIIAIVDKDGLSSFYHYVINEIISPKKSYIMREGDGDIQSVIDVIKSVLV